MSEANSPQRHGGTEKKKQKAKATLRILKMEAETSSPEHAIQCLEAFQKAAEKFFGGGQ